MPRQSVCPRERQQRQSLSDDPFAGRVDFTGVAQVGVHRHVGIGNEFERPKLGLYQQRQQYGVPLAPETVHRNVVVEGGELHVVEGHPFASAPCVAPFGDHRRHVPGIVRMAAFVRFALIPDESPERVGRERPDHGVVQRSRAVLGIVFRIGGENVVPYVPAASRLIQASMRVAPQSLSIRPIGMPSARARQRPK